jgi:hypothetical protein
MGFCFEAGADEDTHFRATSLETLRKRWARTVNQTDGASWLWLNARQVDHAIAFSFLRHRQRSTAAQPLRTSGGGHPRHDGWPFRQGVKTGGLSRSARAEIIHIGQAIMEQKGGGNTIEYFVNTTFNYPTMPRISLVSRWNRIFRVPTLMPTICARARCLNWARPTAHLIEDIPTGIYTIPEISSVGKTEQQLTAMKVPSPWSPDGTGSSGFPRSCQRFAPAPGV